MVTTIKRLVLGTISDDAVLQTLLGGTVDDTRVVYFFSPVIADTLNPAQPAYIVYKLLTKPEMVIGAREAVFRLDVWGIGPDIVASVRDRLEVLFEQMLLSIEGLQVFAKFVNEVDLFDDVGNLSGQSIDLKLGWPSAGPSPTGWIDSSWIQG